MGKELDRLAQALIDINKDQPGSIMDLSNPKLIPEVERIPSGLPSIDYILDGGLPKGRIIELFGPYSSGKSTLALTFLAKAQKIEGKKVVYIDVEHSFDPKYAENIGIDMKHLLLSQPDSGEQVLKIVEALCSSDGVSMIVVDSVASMTTIAANEKAIDGSANIGTLARLLSQHLPRVARAAYNSGTIIVFINQVRMMIGQMYGNPETTPGGKALPHNASVRIDVRAKKAEARKDGIEGCPVVVKIKKSKVSPPFRETELFLKFDKTGFDVDQDLMNMALTNEIIIKSGGWYSYKETKEQGWDSFYAKLKEKDLIKEISDVLEKNNQ